MLRRLFSHTMLLQKLDRIERQELKDLARLHNWNEIEKKFGSGWRRKAQAWLKKKLSEEGANEVRRCILIGSAILHYGSKL